MKGVDSVSDVVTGKVKVGSITMALGLIVSGVVMLLSNFFDNAYLQQAWKMWPLLLIGLGLEFVVKEVKYKRSGLDANIGVSWLSVIVIGFIITTAFTINMAYKILDSKNLDGVLNETVFGNAVAYTRNFEKPPIPITNDKVGIRIDNQQGEVFLEQSKDNQIHIKGEIIARGSGKKQAQQKAENVSVEVFGQENINLKTRLPDSIGTHKIVVNYSIQIPKGVTVDLENKNGLINVRGVQGQVDIRNDVGEINVDEVIGNANIVNKTGSVSITGVTGDITVDNKTGPVTISEPGGNVTATTEIGEIKVSATKPLSKDYNLFSSTGTIQIDIPGNSNLKFSADTVNGIVHGPEQFMTKDAVGPKPHLEGKIGSGEGLMKATSKSGAVEINLR